MADLIPTITADFAGRMVVVTGGTGALGSGVVDELLQKDVQITIPVFDASELKRFERGDDDRVTIIEGVDLTDAKAVESFYNAINGPLWASIHIAGGFDMGPIAEFGADRFEALMRKNVTTCYLSCRAAVGMLRQNGLGGGRIVNVAARNALFPELGPNMVAYTASKAAVAAITQSLGAELADERIWVNAVAPSIIDTSANRRAMPDADHDKWPSPVDLARTIVFLASPSNEATRSAIVPVYGRS